MDPALKGTGMVTQGRKGSDSLSTFPQNIGRIVVDTYCPKDGVIYDPHAGHNSRMELCYKMGRSYIGFDVSKKFMEDNRSIRKAIKEEMGFLKHKNFIRLYEQSSHDVPIPDESCDFTITSPPYWDIEYYGDEPEQLGNAPTYERFLELLYPHVSECYRVLRPGSFVCYFINDFRKKGVFYSYHSDCIDLHKRAGFCHFNTYIVDLGWPINAAFANDVKARKLYPKRHEFCLVMKKPEAK